MKDITKVFDDIAINDKVEIYLGYDTIPATPLFKGVIENIANDWGQEGTGLLRTFSGRDQGEIMTRKLLRQYSSAGETANSTVTEIANRLGMGTTEIAADATPITVVSYDSKYDAIMREICDYAASISKDWYVDINNKLVWQSRPIRTAGVSTLTIGENVKQYTLTRNINEIFNKFWVFGATETFEKDDPSATSACSHTQYTKAPTDLPADHDGWTEAITNWTAGSKSGLHTGPSAPGAGHCGSNQIANGVAVGDGVANEWLWLKRTCATTATIVRVKDEAFLNFLITWNCTGGGTLSKFEITLDAPDTSNYLTYTMSAGNRPTIATATHYTLKLGPGYEVAVGVQDGWVKTGRPDWYDVEAIKFYLEWVIDAGQNTVMNLDCLYFSNLRWRAIDSDVTSGNNYGIREMVVVDDKLHSNTECVNTAAMLKAQKITAPIQLDILMPMDTNILIGDRIPITIPNENLSAVNFDVISVEHMIPPATTHATLVNNERTRHVLKTTSTPEILKGIGAKSAEHLQRRKIIF
jgi:hypothetical protein